MESINPLSLNLILMGIIFFVGGFFQGKYPPKKINSFNGYRTSTSKRNQEVWDFAQEYSSDQFQRLGGFIIILGVGAYFLNFQQMWASYVGILLVILLLVGMIFQIEKELKLRFPKD